MTLCDWIQKTGPKAVARLLKVDPSTVSLWRNGRSVPRAETMLKIHTITLGKVSYRSMLKRGKND